MKTPLAEDIVHEVLLRNKLVGCLQIHSIIFPGSWESRTREFVQGMCLSRFAKHDQANNDDDDDDND